MKILVDKSEIENALQLILNIGSKKHTVDEVSSVLNIVAYILGKMLDDITKSDQVDLHSIVGSLLEILTNNSSYKQEELNALKLVLAGINLCPHCQTDPKNTHAGDNHNGTITYSCACGKTKYVNRTQEINNENNG